MRTFSAKETEWLLELDGVELAGFWRRAFAFLIDGVLAWGTFALTVMLVALLFYRVRQHLGYAVPEHVNFDLTGHHLLGKVIDVLVPVAYFGLCTWWGKGRSVGKRLMKIRVVSLVHRHLGLWHSVERALGYGAAALEGGFGFVQFFIHPYRRCVQDRIAETIVVTERGYKTMQGKLAHALVPDGSAPEAVERVVEAG